MATTMLGAPNSMSFELAELSPFLIVSICLIPGARDAIGKAAYLGAITTVFAHPGRRFGQMAESLILVLGGTLLGLAWSIFGIYLGSLVMSNNPAAAYAIRGVFLAVATLFHGFLRSQAPRLFQFVLLLIIVSVVTLTSVATAVTRVAVTQILYPIFIAAGVILMVNLLFFPEFSSGFLGETTIETLNETATALRKAGHYFTGIDEAMKISAAETSKKTGDHLEPGGPVSTGLKSKVSKSEPFKAPKLSKKVETTAKGSGAPEAPKGISLGVLTKAKEKLRTKTGNCKAAQRECNFEIAYSVLPPQKLKSISTQTMKKLVANTVSIINACESKYALVGDVKTLDSPDSSASRKDHPEPSSSDQNAREHENRDEPASKDKSTNIEHFEILKAQKSRLQASESKSKEKIELDMIKPRREIESGDPELLRFLLKQVVKPYKDVQTCIDCAVNVVSTCIAYAYDVPKLPSGARVPKGIIIEEIDLYVDSLRQALLRFDADAASALEDAAQLQENADQNPDIMPREEVFLISSFLINLRHAASHIHSMLKCSRELVLEHQQRRGRQRIYPPRISWAKWLYTEGGEDEALPAKGRKANRQGETDENTDDETDTDDFESKESLLNSKSKADLEKNAGLDSDRRKNNMLPSTPQHKPPKKRQRPEFGPLSPWLRIREQLADVLEWLQDSDDVSYAFKLSIAGFLVLWPAFIASWNTWFSLNRGFTEVSIGTSFMTFFLRAIGTTLGCLWGWAAWESRHGNQIVCAVLICIGLLPATYVQLGTAYQKAGQVGMVSMCVVALATELETVPGRYHMGKLPRNLDLHPLGTATENFLKRWIAFMIGGVVALVVELVVYPVKARARLVESITAALRQISEMENCIASGIEEGANFDIFNADVLLRFDRASGKANCALSAAETFLPFCSTEPRIKGSFEGLALIYGEILFVLHQIVDRMDNQFQLRTAYGSGPLEEFNAQIHPYRRNVAGSIRLTLFAIHGALTTKLALPQFLPSARLAYLRLINRIREVIHETAGQSYDPQQSSMIPHQRIFRQKYISWSASSAAQAEVIEYLEELIDLTKLLVGASEFRSGLLTRPSYEEYMKMTGKSSTEVEVNMETEPTDVVRKARSKPASGVPRRRRDTSRGVAGDGEEVPASLRRIHSRKVEEGMQRQKTHES
ncbi:hypothetical protein MMC07_000351 [Pseudocyphellaria aurata]|nr:hypothetical protein [Pseudocyphellaria aurata]